MIELINDDCISAMNNLVDKGIQESRTLFL